MRLLNLHTSWARRGFFSRAGLLLSALFAPSCLSEWPSPSSLSSRVWSSLSTCLELSFWALFVRVMLVVLGVWYAAASVAGERLFTRALAQRDFTVKRALVARAVDTFPFERRFWRELGMLPTVGAVVGSNVGGCDGSHSGPHCPSR
jgi:hypothetical protein